jgi:hypothetical protein
MRTCTSNCCRYPCLCEVLEYLVYIGHCMWCFLVHPWFVQGIVSVRIPIGVCTDRARNGNVASGLFTFYWDSIPPTVILDSRKEPWHSAFLLHSSSFDHPSLCLLQ